MSFKTTLFAALIATSSLAQAGVVYNESENGDAPSSGGPTMIGAVVTLEAGTNDILGNFKFSPLDFDDYIFTVNAGSTIKGITFQMFDNLAGVGFGANLYLGNTLLNTFNSAHLSANGSASAFESALPLGTGTYRIDHFNVSGSADNVNYRWSIELDVPHQVPEPATLGLLSIALAGMGIAHRRRAKGAKV